MWAREMFLEVLQGSQSRCPRPRLASGVQGNGVDGEKGAGNVQWVSPRPPSESDRGIRCEATYQREFKPPLREAGPSNHHDGEVDSDLTSFGPRRRWGDWGGHRPRPTPQTLHAPLCAAPTPPRGLDP